MVSDSNEIRKKENHRVLKQLITTLLTDEETQNNTNKDIHLDKKIQMIPKVFYNEFQKQLKVEFRIGNKQFYKIKNLPEFYERMLNHEIYQYGTKLNLLHEEASFCETSKPILAFLLKYAEIMKYTNEANSNYTYYGKNLSLDTITISNTGLDDFFDAMKLQKVSFQKGNRESEIELLEQEPPIVFEISQKEENEFELKANIDIFSYEVLQGKKYIYVLLKNYLYRCQKEYEQTVLKILEVLRKNYTNAVIFNEQELTNLLGVFSHKLKNKIDFSKLPQEVQERCIPKALGVKLFLDYDQNNHLIADIKFCYGSAEFNPFYPNQESAVIPRSQVEENEVLNHFLKTGFMLDNHYHRLVLTTDEQIYTFLSEKIEEDMKKYEVLVTEQFRKKEIKAFHMKEVSVKLNHHLLEIDLSKIGIDLVGLADVMEKYRLKKKFYRLKDGSFLALENNETFAFLDSLNQEMEIDYTKLKQGTIAIPSYRTLYLEGLLKELKNVKIQRNDAYEQMTKDIEKFSYQKVPLPKNLQATLRNYQIIGYEWLKQLENYHFGGILADDMGLRKNVTNTCSST